MAEPAHDPGRPEVVALDVADDEGDEVSLIGITSYQSPPTSTPMEAGR